jgi:hypothetical protein
VCLRGLVLFLRCRRITAALRYGRIAVRCDASPAADVLAALDEPAQRLTPRMILLGVLGRAGDKPQPGSQRYYDDHDDDHNSGRGS